MWLWKGLPFLRRNREGTGEATAALGRLEARCGPAFVARGNIRLSTRFSIYVHPLQDEADYTGNNTKQKTDQHWICSVESCDFIFTSRSSSIREHGIQSHVTFETLICGCLNYVILIGSHDLIQKRSRKQADVTWLVIFWYSYVKWNQISVRCSCSMNP